MMKQVFVSFTFLFFTATLFAQQQAQSKSDLEKERASIQKEIEDVKRSLDETKKNKKETLGQLALLQRKLRLRQAAIQNINGQINFIQGDMNQSWRDILKLRKELDTLRNQYEESVVYAYKNRSNYDFLNFIFSASSFNDALKRVEYLKSYRAYREERAENIRKTQVLLQNKIDGLKVKREEKDAVLQKQNKERAVLEDEKKEKDQFVSKLKSREKELQKDIAVKKRQDDKLQNAIRAAINREVKLARERDIADQKKKDLANAAIKTNPVNTNSNVNPVTKSTNNTAKPIIFESTPEGLIVSENFEKNKGKLPWPVEAGHISIPFGRYSVEGLKGIEGNSPGITIETQVGISVKAIFDGEVSTVFNIEGSSAILIKAGKFFISYSNLASVNVTKGEKVKVGQVLGKAGENSDGNGEIQLVLMDVNKNLNPEQWLRRR
jgi:murein hydrolase activator